MKQDMNPYLSVNFHLLKYCNEHCEYCYATFLDKVVKKPVTVENVKQILNLLHEKGIEKITFAGGEPTLFNGIENILIHAKNLGITTCIVTNGARLEKLIASYSTYLDWVTLSIDSHDEQIQQKIGRGNGNYVENSIYLANMCHNAKIKLKMNTVVNIFNHQENLETLVKIIHPKRWKIFQVLPINGQNNGKVEKLLITSDQFQEFVARHNDLKKENIVIIPEDNDAMTGSYLMIDPEGMFFSNVNRKYKYSNPILQVGVDQAFSEIDFNIQKLEQRGGKYDWENHMS